MSWKTSKNKRLLITTTGINSHCGSCVYKNEDGFYCLKLNGYYNVKIHVKTIRSIWVDSQSFRRTLKGEWYVSN